MEITKHGSEVVINTNGWTVVIKPTLLNWQPSNIHRVSISDQNGMRFMYVQESPHDMHQLICLDSLGVDKAIALVAEIQEKLANMVRFDQRNTLEYSHKLVNMVNM